MNLPNQITFGRLVLAAIFCALLVQYDARNHADGVWMLDLCFVIFVVAAVSDIVDGYLARKHNQVTSLGRVLDPFVDKILVGGAFILLAGRNFVDLSGRNVSGVEAWMVVIIIGRELLVTSLRGVLESSGKQYGANMYGKIKMVVQSVTVGWVLLSLSHLTWPWFKAVGFGLIIATVAITTLSMTSYLFAARSILTERKTGPGTEPDHA